MTALTKSSKTDQSDYWDQSYNSEKKNFYNFRPWTACWGAKSFRLGPGSWRFLSQTQKYSFRNVTAENACLNASVFLHSSIHYNSIVFIDPYKDE